MLSDPVSGSLDIESLLRQAMAAHGLSSKDKETPIPYQVISGSGDAWYYSPTERKMIRARRGSEILVISKEVDEYDRVHVADSSGRYFLVPVGEIIDIGYN